MTTPARTEASCGSIAVRQLSTPRKKRSAARPAGTVVTTREKREVAHPPSAPRLFSGAVNPPQEVKLSKVGMMCDTCQKRETRWVVQFGHNFGKRQCFHCMDYRTSIAIMEVYRTAAVPE